MSKKSYWTYVFLLKGVYNCVISLVFAFTEGWIQRSLGEAPSNPVYVQLFMALAFIFGIGYLWVGKDISKNHDIIRLGIFRQASVFILSVVHAILGNIHPFRIIPGMIDLLFAILFTAFLWQFRKSPLNTDKSNETGLRHKGRIFL